MACAGLPSIGTTSVIDLQLNPPVDHSVNEVDLSSILVYVLDRSNTLYIRDYNSLRLVSRATNVLLCSQFYPHVQSISELGLTDRMISRALKTPEVFFKRFPIMNDLHVPWNPCTIDRTAAISPTHACQLLTDYPQIQSLPPVFLECEGLEGLRGHSVRFATFYPGSSAFDSPGDENNEVVVDNNDNSESHDEEEQADQVEEEEVIDNNDISKLQENQENFVVEELEVVTYCAAEEMGNENGELIILIDRERVLLMMSLIDAEQLKHLCYFLCANYYICACGLPISWLLESPRVSTIQKLSVFIQPWRNVHVLLQDHDDAMILPFPSLKTLHFQSPMTIVEDPIEDRTYYDKYMCHDGFSFNFDEFSVEHWLEMFPNLEKFSAPDSFCSIGMIYEESPTPEWVDTALSRIFSSGLDGFSVAFDDQLPSTIMQHVQDRLFACRTIKHLMLSNIDALTVDDVMPFLRAFPKLQTLKVSSPLINDWIFTVVGKMHRLEYLDVCRSACTVNGLEEYIRWRYRQINNKSNTEMVQQTVYFSLQPDQEGLASIPQEVLNGAMIRVRHLH